jgi:repressor LexA
MLTSSQHKALIFIRRFIARTGHAPSLAEIGTALGIRSRGAVHRHVQALAEAGRIERVAGRKRGIRLPQEPPAADCSLPLLGRIAAGQPIAAIPDQEHLNLADFLLGPDRFALQVVGDSMVEAGILNGDTVVVESRDHARNGEIVVALIDGEEATLKRIRLRGNGQVELIPANHRLQTQVYPAERVAIQGVVVGQLRSYR